ncbi:MAG: hypothetical protein LBV67_12285 [Streptococcaceae bacterium]|jgi:hypothetical protein|nr:hypothetical protein [Streptococcaceae bacterium]
MSLASMETYLDVMNFLHEVNAEYKYKRNAQGEDEFTIIDEHAEITIVIHEYYMSMELINFIVCENTNKIRGYVEQLNEKSSDWQFHQNKTNIFGKRVFGLVGCKIEDLFGEFVREYEEFVELKEHLLKIHLPQIA